MILGQNFSAFLVKRKHIFVFQFVLITVSISLFSTYPHLIVNTYSVEYFAHYLIRTMALCSAIRASTTCPCLHLLNKELIEIYVFG